MRIYTEIVYTWDHDKGELVEESSKSFEYQGEVSQCHRKTFYGVSQPHSHDPITEAASDAYGELEGGIQDAGGTVVDAAKDLYDDAGNFIGDLYDDAGNFIGEMGQGDWSGWTEFGQSMAEMQGFADPTQLPDWLREMWLGGSDLFYEGQEQIKEVVTDPVGTTTDAIDETGSIITGGMDDAITTVEEVVKDTGDTLGVDDAVSTVMDTGQDIGESALETATSLGDELSQGGQTVTENVEGILADNNEPLKNVETKINENIADINEDIETGIDENTDTLNDMEDTVNYNVDQGNALLDNTVSVINDVGTGINEHVLDPLIGPGESLLRDPTSWYENAFHNWDVKSVKDLPGGGGKLDQEAIEDFSEVLGGLGEQLYDEAGAVLGGGFEAGMEGVEMMGQSLNEQLMGWQRDKISGDPFGNQGKTRRLIEQKKTFQNQAPSLINRASPVQYR